MREDAGEYSQNAVKIVGLLENTLSLRTSAHAGVAIPRIFKHLGRKTKLFPSNRGAVPEGNTLGVPHQ